MCRVLSPWSFWFMSIRNRSKGSRSLLTEEFPILLDIGVDTHSKPYNLAQFLDLLPRIFETLESFQLRPRWHSCWLSCSHDTTLSALLHPPHSPLRAFRIGHVFQRRVQIEWTGLGWRLGDYLKSQFVVCFLYDFEAYLTISAWISSRLRMSS